LVSVAPSYQESRPPSLAGCPTSVVTRRVVWTIGSASESSNGITELGHQSIVGGLAASQSSLAAVSLAIHSSTSRRTLLPQPLASACTGRYMTANVSS